jgi:hypothetical protein
MGLALVYVTPFQGFILLYILSQGIALGWYVPAFQA